MAAKKPKSTATVDNTTTSQLTPYAPAAPLLNDMLSSAQAAYAATPKTGSYVAPNADQLAGVDYLRGAAPGLATGSGEMRGLALDQINGKYLNPDTNPFLTGAMDAATNPLKHQLDSQIVSIGDAATMAGAYGGDRSALLKAKANTGFEEAALDARNKIAYQNYANERSIQQNSGALLGQANQLALAPGQLLGNIGDMQQQWAIAKAANDIDAPWAGLDRYAQILQSVQGYGTQTGTQKGTTMTTGTPGGGGVGGVLGGALGGASAGAAFGPWGAGVGAVLGGVGGLF